MAEQGAAERRVTVLVNPASGKGRGAAAGAAAAARLRELGATVQLRTGACAADTRSHAAAAIQERPDALVVVGGDGTLSCLLPEVAGAGVPIALVPAGTGNDFARALQLPLGGVHAAAAAAELALLGDLRAVDIASATSGERQTPFLTVAALGFDALVSERTNRLSWPKGAARYYLALLIELARLRSQPFTVRLDAEPARMRPGILAAVGNTRSYGGGMPICPDASPTDGKLELTLVAPLGRLKLARLFPLLLRGTHTGRAEVFTRRCDSVTISGPGLIVYADGERIGAESVSIGVLPGALRIFVPKEQR